nr:MAG TPA: hypothetical protein [Caudoviricetes sp.]
MRDWKIISSSLLFFNDTFCECLTISTSCVILPYHIHFVM